MKQILLVLIFSVCVFYASRSFLAPSITDVALMLVSGVITFFVLKAVEKE